MKIKALDNFDSLQRGDEEDLPPEYAKAVIKKGLAEALEPDSDPDKKADSEYQNKMDAAPTNKRTRSGNATRNA